MLAACSAGGSSLIPAKTRTYEGYSNLGTSGAFSTTDNALFKVAGSHPNVGTVLSGSVTSTYNASLKKITTSASLVPFDSLQPTIITKMTPASPPANGSYVYVDSLGVQHDVTTVSASNVQVTEKFTDIKGAKWLIETSTSDGASYVCRFSVSTGESGNFSVVLPAGTAVNPTDYQPNHGRQLEWIHCKFLGQAAEFTGGVALVAVSGAGLSALVGFAPGVVVLGAAGLIFGGIAGLTMIGHAILC